MSDASTLTVRRSGSRWSLRNPARAAAARIAAAPGALLVDRASRQSLTTGPCVTSNAPPVASASSCEARSTAKRSPLTAMSRRTASRVTRLSSL